jgi:hypothetical protein
MSDTVSKSWFCVFANPETHGYEGTAQEIVDKVIDCWMEDNPQRSCAVTYCISKDGLRHLHAVLEDTKAMRFSAVKKVYPSMHIEPTKGNKDEAEDYINKRGKFAEDGEEVIYSNRRGEIKGCQGQRRDLSVIDDMIEQGKTPNEIMGMSLSYRRYEKIIRDAYYHKRSKDTPIKREVRVYWHVGESRSGKSHEMVGLMEKHGEDNVYLVSDYKNGFDRYNGEPYLFMDEFRGGMRYAQLLIILDGYKAQIPCRYSNAIALWNEVHITSVLPPERCYSKMVEDDRELDTVDQIKRRIDYVVYHQKIGDDYSKVEIPMSAYTNYDEVKHQYKGMPDWCIESEQAAQIDYSELPL